MKITTELVDYISELSRLSLEPEEKESVAAQLERIVAYMDVLNKLDTTGVEPLSHVFPVKNVFREDEVFTSKQEAERLSARARLLENAPAQDGETFLVPKAVE